MFFNDNMRKAREKAGLSQVDLAEKVGIPFQTINRYENTDIMPRIGVIVKIAQALNITVNELLGLPEYPNPQNLVNEWERIVMPNFFMGYDAENNVVEIVSAFGKEAPLKIPYDNFVLEIAKIKEKADEEIKVAYNALLSKHFVTLVQNKYGALKQQNELMKSGFSFDEAYFLVNEQENPLNKE